MKTTAIFLLAAASVLAQGPRGPANRAAAGLDMSKLETVTGAVSAVNVAYGTQYPSIALNQRLIKLAPVWYLLEKNFEIKTGDTLTVLAAPSRLPDDTYLYAVEIGSAATGARLSLRDAAGIPLWSGPSRGRGNPGAPRNGAGCVDPASITTASGVIEKLTMGLGIQMPAMVLKDAGGKLLTIRIGPERILLEADFELKEGQSVTVRYGKAAADELVALQIANAAGDTITLRHDDGSPAWD